MNTEPNTPILASDPAGARAIVLAAKRGDERAFGILFRRYLPKMFAVTLRYTRPKGCDSGGDCPAAFAGPSGSAEFTHN